MAAAGCGSRQTEGSIHGNVTAPAPGACCATDPVNGYLVVDQSGRSVKAIRIASGRRFEVAVPPGRYRLTFTPVRRP
jgi:hypothetical protein